LRKTTAHDGEHRGSLHDIARPQLIGLITRSGSRRKWELKFWRNVGEAVNVKTVFPDTRLVSINLGTELKEELVEA
jgi:hypothetical protein